jgi:hypothetical protein
MRKHAYVSLIEVPSLVRLMDEAFMRTTTLIAASTKWLNMKKHVLTINTLIYV